MSCVSVFGVFCVSVFSMFSMFSVFLFLRDSTPRFLHSCHFLSISRIVSSGSYLVSSHSCACCARVCLTMIVGTSIFVAQETLHLTNVAHGSGASVLGDVPILRDCLR